MFISQSASVYFIAYRHSAVFILSLDCKSMQIFDNMQTFAIKNWFYLNFLLHGYLPWCLFGLFNVDSRFQIFDVRSKKYAVKAIILNWIHSIRNQGWFWLITVGTGLSWAVVYFGFLCDFMAVADHCACMFLFTYVVFCYWFHAKL